MIDDQYLEGSVRSAQPNCPLCTIWGTLQHVWGHRYDGYNLIVIIYGQNRSNFPVWACSGGVQQGAQGGAWLRRIPGDRDGHFWMWALTLETKKWVAWSCVGKLDCWVELHCKNLSRFKRGRCVGLGEKTKDGLFYWQTCSINAYWCKELDNQLKYFSTESRNAARQSAIAWDQGKTYWIEYFLGAKINHFHWG